MGKTTFDFAGQVAVVTGGCHGIGWGAAEAFAAAGAHAVLIDIDDAAGEAGVETIRSGGGKATYQHCDVTNSAEVNATFEAIVGEQGRIDVLVNSAGGFFEKLRIDETSDEEWQRILGLNLTSTFYCMRAAVPVFKRQGSGSIINIGSLAGLTAAYASPPYSAAKSGVHSLSRVAALELAPHGVTVNTLAPGTTSTGRVDALHGAQGMEQIAAGTPLGRVGEVGDIASWALFLASPEARYVTGQTINIDGGRLMV